MPLKTPGFLLMLLATAVAPSFALAQADDVFAKVVQPLLRSHCVKCHGEREKIEGKVNLLAIASGDDLLRAPDLLDDMIGVLQEHDMPPKKEPPLEPESRRAMVEQLRSMLGRSLTSRGFPPTPIHRMNRLQYNNAVVDLLELDRDIFPLPERLMRRYTDYFKPQAGSMPEQVKVANRPLGKDVDGARAEGFMGVAAFPQDLRAEHGFDNQGDHLTLSPLLMESLLRLSRSVVESRDLNPKECRSWGALFEPPQAKAAEGEAYPREAYLEAIRTRLALFLRRAYRRPVDPQTLDRFVAFAQRRLDSGAGFTDTMKTIVGATLVSPEFIYLYRTPGSADRPAPDAAGRSDDFELASRLSFFLWNGIPDDALLDLAEAGKLRDPAVLGAQIDRMLDDPRTVRFCDSFASQWLQLDRLIASIPDPDKFEAFYFTSTFRSSMHMMMEPLLLFDAVYLENRPVTDLLDPKFTYQSEDLRRAYLGKADAKHHEVGVVTFNRIPLDDPRWGGVITNAAVMTMTSSPVRTQPITRGAWVNAVIFNDPPKPPPADVPPLPKADDERLKSLTIRERFAEHRKREDCASCHNRIDPVGFALENYGPTGIWRDQYENGRDVDPHGVLFNRYGFQTAVEFKQIIVTQKLRFIRAFAGHLLAYALGRELTPADSPALDAITERAMSGDDRLRTILKSVAMSEPFLDTRTREHPAGDATHEP